MPQNEKFKGVAAPEKELKKLALLLNPVFARLQEEDRDNAFRATTVRNPWELDNSQRK